MRSPAARSPRSTPRSGLPWIAPELREDRGEFEAAAPGRLPELIRVEDLRGDLQMHSTWSDGRATLEEMVAACAARGYEYMAITDHSKALAMVRGLDAGAARPPVEGDRRRPRRHPEIRILQEHGDRHPAPTAPSISKTRMIAGLDLVVVSIHSRFELPPDEQTERILRALRHPRVGILAHPTGRIIDRRKPIEFDLERVLREAAPPPASPSRPTRSPHRLDLKDTHLVLARDLGCKIVVSTDAHRPRELENMRYGVDQARRAGLEARRRAEHPAARRVPRSDPALGRGRRVPVVSAGAALAGVVECAGREHPADWLEAATASSLRPSPTSTLASS